MIDASDLVCKRDTVVQKSCSCDFLYVLVVCQEICGIVLKFYIHLAISLQITPLSIAGLTKKSTGRARLIRTRLIRSST